LSVWVQLVELTVLDVSGTNTTEWWGLWVGVEDCGEWVGAIGWVVLAGEFVEVVASSVVQSRQIWENTSGTISR